MDDRTRGRERLVHVTGPLLLRSDVAEGRMFGSEGYSVRGKLFAFVSTDGSLVVKLPVERIEALGLDNVVMRGSAMREWASVPYVHGESAWASVIVEAHAFVDSITPGRSEASDDTPGNGHRREDTT